MYYRRSYRMPASKKKELSILIHGVKPYVEKKGEKYMNKKQLEHFRSILMGWKTELLDEVSKTVHSMQDETVNHPDPNDRASQETDMSLELRSRDRERKLIKKIDEAFAKIDSGEYGHCETCDVEIGVQRLEARPTATLCIDCKTLDEIREKQMG
jgi:DnaK suppressor protein